MRCSWCEKDTDYIKYHDTEWGKPLHDDRKLFEFLVLEGMQAGLSWLTVLKKREALRLAFDNFEPEKIASYDDTRISELMENKDIIRNQRKIRAAISNARLFLDIQREYGSFDAFIWRYTDYTPIINDIEQIKDVPATSKLSDTISQDLKRLGFKFVGSTTVYSYMQAIGMVNDHIKTCDFRF